ncbi:MAG TPA: hypothetical protein PLI97_09830 [Fluviicola sp.]|nr:hypothetical protein [Fluviicola sp.]
MIKQLFILFTLFSGFTVAQTTKKSWKNVLNEFAISTNYGLEESGFFGGGLSIGHCMKPDKVVGFGAAVAFDFYHFNLGDCTPPKSTDFRHNQHFYTTNVSIPFDLQLNFGKKTRFLIEIGGQFGANIHTVYRANVLDASTNSYLATRNQKGLGAFVGLNGGLGISIPIEDQYAIVLKPAWGLNLYSEEPAYLNQKLIHSFVKFNVSFRLF